MIHGCAKRGVWPGTLARHRTATEWDSSVEGVASHEIAGIGRVWILGVHPKRFCEKAIWFEIVDLEEFIPEMDSNGDFFPWGIHSDPRPGLPAVNRSVLTYVPTAATAATPVPLVPFPY